MKCFSTIVRTHSVDLHHDKAELCQAMHVEEGSETMGNETVVGTSVDVLDHWILPIRIEIGRFNDHSPDVCLSIAAFGYEWFRQPNPILQKLPDIRSS